MSQSSTKGKQSEQQQGSVIAVVSGKGGPGKTVIAASFAYILIKVRKKVLIIDTDFHTRGISFYLIGDLAEKQEIEIRPNSCLSYLLNTENPADQAKPAIIRRTEGEEYHILFPDKNLSKGALIDAGGFSNKSSNFEKAFFDCLNSICNRFRHEYDYIILDTRGGYDCSSAVPALISDGIVVVLEIDKLSFNQVSAFLESIKDYSERFPKAEAQINGFISNKWVYDDPDDITILNYLKDIHGGIALGNIPFDRAVAMDYGNKLVPFLEHPGSDYAYYLLLVIKKLFAPDINWKKQAKKDFEKIFRYHHKKWQIKQAKPRIQKLSLIGQLFTLIVGSGIYYLWSRPGIVDAVTFHLFFITFLFFTSISILGRIHDSVTRKVVKWLHLPILFLIGFLLAGILLVVTYYTPRQIRSQQKRVETLEDSENRLESAENEILSLNDSILSLKKIIQPRSHPEKLSTCEITTMIKEKGFFDSEKNSKGQFPKEYDLKNNIIIDHFTNLMWQRSGSSYVMGWDEAPKYIQDLNEKSFAGFSDWRLPTIEELGSLLELAQKQGALHIDPRFDPKQQYCWSADISSTEENVAWLVSFVRGTVTALETSNNNYVRAVRTNQ